MGKKLNKVIKYIPPSVYILSGTVLSVAGGVGLNRQGDQNICDKLPLIPPGFNQMCEQVDEIPPDNKIQIGIGMLALSYPLFAKARNEATINHQAIYIEGLLRALKTKFIKEVTEIAE